jgi:hypothetical protein
LLEAVDRAVEEGLARSRNDFLTMALHGQLAKLRRAAIDAAFAGMATDAEYQQEASEVVRAFEEADWEALGIAEEPA